MPQHYLSNLASLQEIFAVQRYEYNILWSCRVRTPLRGYMLRSWVSEDASLSGLRTHSPCRAVWCSPHATCTCHDAASVIRAAKLSRCAACEVSLFVSCATRRRGTSILRVAARVVERPSAFCYDSRLPVSSRAGSCEPSRRSSAVEQLIRNQQVVSSILTAGSSPSAPTCRRPSVPRPFGHGWSRPAQRKFSISMRSEAGRGLSP